MKIKKIYEDFESINIPVTDSEKELEEDILNEVNLKDLIQGIKDRSADKAIDRGITKSRGADRTKLNQMTNQAKKQIAKELQASYAKNYQFYLPGSKEPMDWEAWKTFLQREDLSDSDWNNIFNAIVVDRNDYFIRRGPELLDKENIRFYRGKNDALKYKWEGGKNGQAVWVRETADMPSGDSSAEESSKFYITAELPRGVNIVPVDGYTQTVQEGAEFKFTIALEDNFIKKQDEFKVLVNDQLITPDDKEIYTISDIKEDQKIKIEGIEFGKPSDSYTDTDSSKESSTLESEDGPNEKKTKEPIDYSSMITDETVDRFKRLVALSRREGYEFKVIGPNRKELTPKQIKELTKETILDVRLPRGGKFIKFGPWYQSVKSLKLLEDISEEELKEALLTEAPIVLSDKHLNDPDFFSLKHVAKDLSDKEKAERERIELEKKRAAVIKAYDSTFNTIKLELEVGAKKPSDILEILFEEVVPSSGMADSVAGEIVRAMMRILYRDYNDGDKFFEGYGLETCGGSAEYLCDTIPECASKIDKILDQVDIYANNDDKYTEAIEDLTRIVLTYLISHPEQLAQFNTTDSREYSYDYIAEHQPRYEFELSVSDDLDRLIDESIIDSWKLNEYVESNLEYESCFEGATVERPFGYHDHSVTISNLTKEGLERFEEWERDLNHFWQDLVDEYADELAELDADDKDEEDMDFDDSLEEDFYLRSGDETMAGWIDNLSDKDIDTNVRDYNRIAKLLKLKDPKDLVIYIDIEGTYDPCTYDSFHYTLTETPIKFEIRNIPVVARLENGNIVLYFANESHATKYLRFCDTMNYLED